MLINLRLLKQVKLIQIVGYLEAENTELKYMDGIYLLQNIQTNKIQATFCQFKDSNQSNKILKNQILFLKRVN